MNAVIDRRGFLKGTSALIVSFAIPSTRGRPAPTNSAKPVDLNTVETFLAIDADGEVTVYSGKVDLGTGVRTAFSQIVAEELDVPLANITIIVAEGGAEKHATKKEAAEAKVKANAEGKEKAKGRVKKSAAKTDTKAGV